MKRTRGKLTEQVMKAAPVSTSIEEAAERIVKGLWGDVTCPPTNLPAIGKRANVVSIVKKDLLVSGQLEVHQDGFQVAYDSNLEWKRARFTIAHEIGHAIVARLTPKQKLNDAELERICDVFAAEILLPTNIFVNEYKKLSKGDASIIHALSRTFDASLQSVEIRVKVLMRRGLL